MVQEFWAFHGVLVAVGLWPQIPVGDEVLLQHLRLRELEGLFGCRGSRKSQTKLQGFRV